MKEFDEFEQELRRALERRPAPPGLKRKVMERRSARQVRRRTWFGNAHFPVWVKAAAVLVLAAMLGGGVMLRDRQIEEERRGEAAKRQVFTALRITARALNQVQERLAAHDRGGE